ncbi:MAG: SDR family oxidoreductase [Sphingomonadaceae bacterium]|nr:SDR family oxidoreductase [Sphingomonadaceae bacterium]
MRFEGKVAVVTGGASGIGRGTAEAFLAEGAQVVVGDIDETSGEAMAREGGERFAFRRADVTREADIIALLDEARERFGGLDILFNNAGAGGSRATIDEITADEWDAAQALLLRSCALGIRHAVPLMIARGGGAIVNTASVAACQAGAAPIAYSVAKAGVRHLSKVAAAQLARHGIRVNSVSPGFIQTNIFASTIADEDGARAQINAVVGMLAPEAQPIARGGEARDVAEAVLFLASDAAAFITGTDLLVDGGLTVGPQSSWDPEVPGIFDAILAQHGVTR